MAAFCRDAATLRFMERVAEGWSIRYLCFLNKSALDLSILGRYKVGFQTPSEGGQNECLNGHYN